MASSETCGQLMIIGGAEDKEGACKILREFVRRAGGLRAQIVIITVSTERPQEVGDNYIKVLKRLGVEHVRIIDVMYREDTSSPSFLTAIQKATGVFFTGEKQSKITSILKGTEIDRVIHKRYSEGIVVGGTSAAASMMSNTMIVEGEAQTHPRMEIVETDSGMSFLPEVVIDQHFAQRGRLGRLLAAVAKQPDLLGLGIDEDTAVVVNGKELTVIGEGAVTVLDLQDITYKNVHKLLKDEALALCGVKLYILPHGYQFDLGSRRPKFLANPPQRSALAR